MTANDASPIDAPPSFLEIPEATVQEPIADRERSSLQLYLQEIGKTPLLTIDEEVTLATRILRGDEAARAHMIRANLRLVVTIVKDYQDFGLPLLDLISEGNIGLIKAVDRFNPHKGAKLSTYAAWWIKQSVKQALATQGKTIRLPAYLLGRISEVRRATTQLTAAFGREPTDEELGAELQIPAAKIAHLKSVSVQPASLDAIVGKDDATSSLGELVADPNAVSPYEGLREENRIADLHGMVASLDAREAEIIKLRFGLEGREELTLEEVGERFRITRERVRQLEYLALKKLRRAMVRHETIRSRDEIEREEQCRQRMHVIREFIESRTKRSIKQTQSEPHNSASTHERDQIERPAA